MLVKQISVFVENRPGTIYEVTDKLRQNNVDILAFSIADTENYGILRLIVRQPEETYAALSAAGFTAHLSAITALKLENRVGALNEALLPLREAAISVEYGYSYLACAQDGAIILLSLSDNERGAALLRERGFTVLEADDLIPG